MEELLGLSGWGERRAARYGARLLEALEG
jgi:hypothetical protein